MLPVTTNAPTPIKSTPTTPTAAEDRDTYYLSRRDNDQTEFDATTLPTDMQPEPATVAQPAGEQAGLGEDDDVTGDIVKAEPIWDDPALSMRAGLIVNGVRFFPRDNIAC
jgi:hypothetical protein